MDEKPNGWGTEDVEITHDQAELDSERQAEELEEGKDEFSHLWL